MDTQAMTTSLGICVGASTVTAVKLSRRVTSGSKIEIPGSKASEPVITVEYPHEGDPGKTLASALESMDLSGVEKVAVTGRKFRHLINLPSISEPEAVEHAYHHVKPTGVDFPAIVSAGGETFMVYKLDARGQISNVVSGNKCAAGTGEFFQQQLRRLDTSLNEVSTWSSEIEPYPVSGRCSVFCKSDCTHATNIGISKKRVAAGLGKMMAGKILELLKNANGSHVMLTGGTSKNEMMVSHLKKAIPGLFIPRQAPYFEALGAALWAMDQPNVCLPEIDSLFVSHHSRFAKLPSLNEQRVHVEFKKIERDKVRPNDNCLLGLDVGSTTTKAVLLRQTDNALLSSVYLRTNGDPIGAARRCYATIGSQIKNHISDEKVNLIGIGVCGSGRHIAGLHAMTQGVINEITAHAAAAIFFDPHVDTIFEIGGQDAKYTHIANAVPTDYAMNEACSAGTGSFLEESAWETMGVPMEEIADMAMRSLSPPNFSDQCAAFIASDIKNAIQEGLPREDIVAGLVYSVCMNYNNRVKGHRPVGRKVFMQGGVCYNHAVPLAMAELVGKDIIVPPEPGLMGAFGAALELRKRLNNGLMQPGRYCLNDLADRSVTYGRPFKCNGGQNKCDRRCSVARIQIEGHTHPFGGACNRFDNLRKGLRVNTDALNLVRARQELVFGKYAPEPLNRRSSPYRGRIGINRSFMVNSYYPLYANYFSALGFEPVLPKNADPKGIDQRNAPFCFPGELAHGFFHDLISDPEPLEYIFLPHLKSLPTLDGERHSQACPLVQGEPYYLQATFREQIDKMSAKGTRVLSPLLDLSHGGKEAEGTLVSMALKMGISRREAETAFQHAWSIMQTCLSEMQAMGRMALNRLQGDPDAMGIVLFARPYNGYAHEAHMGIPDKFASRNILVIPLDFLDIASEPSIASMYWGSGQRILMTAQKIQSHPQLYGTYITNFSCGPDSFILNYFRRIMADKPSLTLELDSHSADAGIETRIDAFLDIVHAHRMIGGKKPGSPKSNAYQPAAVSLENGAARIRTSDGRQLPITDPSVTLLFPSMGILGTDALAAAFRSAGINALALPASNEEILKIGRGHTTCKECLPLILTTGALLKYVRTKKSNDETVIYFMPNGPGPCRFGQYNVFMQDLIQKLKLPNTAIFSLSSDVGYEGLPADIHRRAWRSVVTSDVFEDIRAMLLANALHREAAIALFESEYHKVLLSIETGRWKPLEKALQATADRFKQIPLTRPVSQVPLITLAGEIFVRRDGLSRQYLTEYLASKGFATVCAPVAEWILYSDYIIDKGLVGRRRKGVQPTLKALIKRHVMRKDERRIKKILSRSGLLHVSPINVKALIDTAKTHISPHLNGEAILTVGNAMREVATETCGAIAIGPFGCMPNRISEAILMETMSREDKLAQTANRQQLGKILSEINDLPFLAIESDGSPLTQQTQARLEAFCIRARRLHQRMMAYG